MQKQLPVQTYLLLFGSGLDVVLRLFLPPPLPSLPTVAKVKGEVTWIQ
jgi:hypothetical protein